MLGDNVATEAQTIAGWAFPQNPYDQMGDYGRCPQNIGQLFNGYVVSELPFGRGKQFSQWDEQSLAEPLRFP